MVEGVPEELMNCRRCGRQPQSVSPKLSHCSRVLAAEGDFEALEGAWLRVTLKPTRFRRRESTSIVN